ncbi:MAG: type I-B CRISPR-associated protein Cas8b/Csh1 [Candidatus Altiarchaeota archaeon]|nr:type I-B CRISPR-associated protein Cas8b/Csh1 [Candidatus Altiarchaeota archaeon]
MIQAIKEIGRQVSGTNLTQEIFLKGISTSVNEERQYRKESSEPQKQYVVIIKFDLKNKIIKTEIEGVNSGGKDSGKDYLWVGDTIRHKLYCPTTTRRIDRILTTTLPELMETDLKKINPQIEAVIKEFYDNKDREHIIKPEKLVFFESRKKEALKKASEFKERLMNEQKDKRRTEAINQFKKFYNEIGGKLKETKNAEETVNEAIAACETIKGDTENFLKKAYSIDIELLIKDLIKSIGFNYYRNSTSRSNNISFYTVQIDDTLICKTDEYRGMIYNEKINNLFTKKSKYLQKDSICSVCGGNHKETTSDSTNLSFKFYMRDKIGFSSNFDGNFQKNYNICKECYQHLMMAETFIDSNLNSWMGKNLQFYILPQFILETNELNFLRFSEKVKSRTTAVANLKSTKTLQEDLEKFKEYEILKNSFVLNYLFYNKPGASQEFKILKLIKDVPPSRLDFITEIENEISSLINEKHDGNKNLKIDLNQIWSCVPIKVDNQGNTESGYYRFLDVIDSIFSKYKIDYDFLLHQFSEVIEIIYFGRKGYNIWTEQDFTKKLLQMNFLLLFLKKIGCLGGFKMIETEGTKGNNIGELIPPKIQQYWNDLDIYEDESRRGLFLLGYLIGEIGKKQKSKSIDKKPILNKITFQGMGREKLLRLVNEISEKLVQYDRLKYNENIFSACKMLIDKNISKWELSDQENVFYTLSGFAFSNYLGYSGWVARLTEELAKKEKAIIELKEKGKEIKNGEELLEESKKQLAGKEYKELNKTLEKINELIDE